jgi:hypothetical protein
VLATEIDDTVVQSGVQCDDRPAVVRGLLVLAFCGNRPLSVGDLHGKLRIGLCDNEELLDVQLEVLDGCALDQLFRLLDQTVYEDNALGGNLARELDHLPAQRLALCDHSLDGVQSLPEGDEGELRTLCPGILHNTAEDDLWSTGLIHVGGVLVLLADLREVDTSDLLGRWDVWLRAEHGKLAIVLLGNIVRVGGLLLSLLFGLALCGFFGLCDSSQWLFPMIEDHRASAAHLLLLFGGLLQGALGGTLLALCGRSILRSLGDGHDVVSGFVGHDVCMAGSVQSSSRERCFGGEDLYRWWGVSQWAGRAKEDTEDV